MEPEKDILDSKILIVDDDQHGMKLLALFLQIAGFSNVRSVVDSRNAIAEYLNFKPDLLILDILMPHIDGFAIFEKVKSLDPNLHNVLIMTALNSPKTQLRAMELGAKDFLLKPIDRKNAISRIIRVLKAQKRAKKLAKHTTELENIARNLQA